MLAIVAQDTTLPSSTQPGVSQHVAPSSPHERTVALYDRLLDALLQPCTHRDVSGPRLLQH